MTGAHRPLLNVSIALAGLLRRPRRAVHNEATLALLQSAAPLQDPLAVLRHASATPLAPELLKLAAKAARCSSAASAPSGDGEAAAAAEGSDGGKDGTESLSLAALLQACQRQLGGATPPPGAGEPPPSPPAPSKPARSTKFSTGFGEGGDQSALRMVKHDRRRSWRTSRVTSWRASRNQPWLR